MKPSKPPAALLLPVSSKNSPGLAPARRVKSSLRKLSANFPAPLRVPSGKPEKPSRKGLSRERRPAGHETAEKSAAELACTLAAIRATLEAAADGILTEDEQGGIPSFNSTFEEMWGIPPALLKSGRIRKIWDFAGGRMRHPDHHQPRIDEIGASGRGSFDLLELGDGRYVERYSKIPFIEGRSSGRVWSFRDVTERHQTEISLRRLAAIVEGSEDAIISKDLEESIITTWNPAAERIFGYSAGEIIGRPIHILIPADRPLEEQMLLDSLKMGKKVDHFETVRIHKNGGPVHVSLTISPIRNALGDIVGASKIARDITARKTVEMEGVRQAELLRGAEATLQSREAELMRVSRSTMLGELTAAIAHEIAQPLAAMSAHGSAAVRWLNAEPPNVSEARLAGRCIVKEVERASAIIQRIRALFVKGPEPAGKSSLLNETVKEAIDLTRGEIKRRGALLESELTEGLPLMKMDPVQIQQVLVNLIINGLDAMDEVADRPHVLRVSTGALSPGEVFVSVEDSGRGLPEGQQNRLFEAFYTTKAHGLGMGLSISRSIAEAHGGHLQSQATASGKGILFRLTLPVEGLKH